MNITSDISSDHNPRRVTDMDAVIGTRLRLARLAAGMSQTAVADHVGITFQQIQKYEKGTNRIAATTLNNVAGLFGVSILYFFDDVSNEIASTEVPLRPRFSELLMTRRGQRLLTNFAASPEGVQTAVFKLLEETSGGGEQSSV